MVKAAVSEIGSTKLGGTVLIVGTLLLLATVILHPRVEGLSLDGFAKLVTDDPSLYYLSHIVAMPFAPFMLLGLLTLYGVLNQRGERIYSLPAIVSVGLATLLLIVAIAIDGFMGPALAQNYVEAPGAAKQSARTILGSSDLLTHILLAPAFFALWAGGGLFGAAMVKAKLYNRGLSWAGVVLGLIGVFGYIVGIFGPYWVTSIALRPYAGAFTIWFLVLGIFLYRGR